MNMPFKHSSRTGFCVAAAWVVGGMGIAVTAYAALAFSMWTPYADHWTLVVGPLLRAEQVGWLRALWEQDNDSRMPVARAVYLACLKVSGWRLWLENAVTVGLACATAAGFVKLVVAGVGESRCRQAALAVTGVLLIFGLQQSLTWQFGVVSAYALVVTSMMAMTVLTTRRTWLRLMGACGVAMLGTLSFANGWVIWPLIGLALIRPQEAGESGRGRVALMLLVLAAAFGIFVTVYFNGYVFKSSADSGKPIFERLMAAPLETLRFFVCLIGAMTADVWPVAERATRFWWVWWSGAFFGVFYLLSFCWAGLGLVREKSREVQGRMWPFAMLALFGLGSAVLVTMARAGHPAGNPFEPRYITFVMWMPLGTLGVLWVARGRRERWAAGVLASILLGGWLGGAVIGWKRMEADYYSGRIQSAAMMLRAVALDPDLLVFTLGGKGRENLSAALFETMDRIESKGYLRPRALRDRRVDAAQVDRDGARDRGRLERVERQPGLGLYVKALALAPREAAIADAMVFSVEEPGGVEEWLGVAQKRVKFTATAKKKGITAFEGRIGFEYRTPPTAEGGRLLNPVLPPLGEFTLRAYVLDLKTERLWLIGDPVVVDAAE